MSKERSSSLCEDASLEEDGEIGDCIKPVSLQTTRTCFGNSMFNVIRQTEHPTASHSSTEDWGGRLRSTRVQGQHAYPIFQSFDQHGAATDLRIERIILAGHWPALSVNCVPLQSLCKHVDQHTHTAHVIATAPRTHSPVTSDRTTVESSSHSSVRPLTPHPAQASASLLCSRKCAPPTPQLLFVNRRLSSTLPSVVSGQPLPPSPLSIAPNCLFCFALPFLQSTHRLAVTPCSPTRSPQ